MSYKRDDTETSHQYKTANDMARDIDILTYTPPETEIGDIFAISFLTEEQVALATVSTNSPFAPQYFTDKVILPRLGEEVEPGKTRLQRELEAPESEHRYSDAKSYISYYLKGVIEKSFGKSHGSVGDKAKIEFWFENIPRMATLLQARASRGQDLLQATSRGLPFINGLYVPKVVKANSLVHQEVQKVSAKNWRTYWDFLQQQVKPQFAMYHIPLFAMTNNTDTLSVRGLIDTFLSSTGGFSPTAHKSLAFGTNVARPEVLQDLAWRVLNIAREHYPNLLRDYIEKGQSKNFEPLRVYQAGSSDFLDAENKPLERLIQDDRLVKLRNGELDVSLLSVQGEEFINPDELKEALRTRNNAYLAFLETNVRYQIAMRVPISDYHDWWRHRTVIRTHRPFKKILDDIVVAESGGHNFVSLYAEPLLQSEKNKESYTEAMTDQLELCLTLSDEGIPWYEVIGFLPHSMLNYETQTIGGMNLLYIAADRMCISARPSIQKTMEHLKMHLLERKSPVAEFMNPHGYYSLCSIAAEWNCKRSCAEPTLQTTKGLEFIEEISN